MPKTDEEMVAAIDSGVLEGGTEEEDTIVSVARGLDLNDVTELRDQAIAARNSNVSDVAKRIISNANATETVYGRLYLARHLVSGRSLFE